MFPVAPLRTANDGMRSRQKETQEYSGSEYEEDFHYPYRGLTTDWPGLPSGFRLLKPEEERPMEICVEGNVVPGTTLNERMPYPGQNAEGDVSSILLSSENAVVDTGLEVGNIPITSEPDDMVNSTRNPAAK